MIRAFFDTGRAARARGFRVAVPAVAAAALLAGCVTSDYRYREDNGAGYYYGTPAVEYRELTPYPYGPYGPYGAYGPYGSYRYWHPSPYDYRGYDYYRYYGYGPYGGYPYGYPYRYAPRRHVTPRTDNTPDRPRSPWRDLDSLRPRQRSQPPGGATGTPGMLPPPPPAITPTAPRGGGQGERIRRAKERASGREDTR